MEKSVYCITFKKNNSLHMIVDNKKFAQLYCSENDGFNWECWSVLKNG